MCPRSLVLPRLLAAGNNTRELVGPEEVYSASAVIIYDAGRGYAIAAAGKPSTHELPPLLRFHIVGLLVLTHFRRRR